MNLLVPTAFWFLFLVYVVHGMYHIASGANSSSFRFPFPISQVNIHIPFSLYLNQLQTSLQNLSIISKRNSWYFTFLRNFIFWSCIISERKGSIQWGHSCSLETEYAITFNDTKHQNHSGGWNFKVNIYFNWIKTLK